MENLSIAKVLLVLTTEWLSSSKRYDVTHQPVVAGDERRQIALRPAGRRVHVVDFHHISRPSQEILPREATQSKIPSITLNVSPLEQMNASQRYDQILEFFNRRAEEPTRLWIGHDTEGFTDCLPKVVDGFLGCERRAQHLRLLSYFVERAEVRLLQFQTLDSLSHLLRHEDETG